jgi:CBS domain-containing protein
LRERDAVLRIAQQGEGGPSMAPIESYPAVAHVLPGIPVKDVLADKPEQIWSVAPAATVYQAVELMAAAEVSALLVLDEERLTGIVTERDYARKVILKGKSSRDTRVDEIMTAHLVTIDPETTLQECMSLMTTRRVRHLPVLEGGRLVGIISIGDVVRATLLQQRHTLEEMQRYVSGESKVGT